MGTDGLVQAPVLYTHRAAIAATNVVKLHRDFYDRAVQRKKKLEHLRWIGLGPCTIESLDLPA